MLQSDRFWRFLRTSVRLRLTCPSNFEGTPYAASSMIRPGSRLVEGTGSGAARAAPVAAKAPPVSAAVLRMNTLLLLLAMGPPPNGCLSVQLKSSMRPPILGRQDALGRNRFRRKHRLEAGGGRPPKRQEGRCRGGGLRTAPGPRAPPL